MNPLYLFTFACMFTFVSCKTENPATPKPTSPSSSTAILPPEAPTPPSLNGDTTPQNAEVFQAFFSKFVNDTLFQKARIQFPIEISILDENYQPKTEWIHKEAFVALQFQSDKAANLGEYRQDIVVNNTKAEIQIRGNETDISADYFFVLLDGKWFLKSWADHSL